MSNIYIGKLKKNLVLSSIINTSGDMVTVGQHYM